MSEQWDQRQLCADGSCIGVIGDDGTCKTCGRVAPNWGDERKRGLVEPHDDDDDDDVDDDGDDGGSDATKAADVVAFKPRGEPVAWTERRLCSDGACIGVIGSDGNCKVCGKAAADYDDHDDHDDHDDDDYDDEDPDDHDDGEVAGDDDEPYDDEQDDEAEADDHDPDEIDPPAPVGVNAAGNPGATTEAHQDPDDPTKPRALCPDGACVGVIGADGRCKVCGKAAE
jgi:hypothetical protein